MLHEMAGHWQMDGRTLQRAGFFPAALGSHGLPLTPSRPLFQRGAELPASSQELLTRMQGASDIERAAFMTDPGFAQQFLQAQLDVQRAITSATTALPIRENLEAPARLLVPTDTPLRSMLPRVPGAGTAAAWRQITSLGGGYGFQTTVTTGASSTTQTVGSTAGMVAGDSLWFATTGAARTISSVTNATTVVLTSTISTTTGETVTNATRPVGAGAGTIADTQTFYAESGAPADHATVYAAKSASYKLLGTFGSVTAFAQAAGMTYQNTYEAERTNAVINLSLNEENALINSSSTATTPPWGDGANALGFAGMLELIATGNGTPADQIQTAVGGLTMSAIDNMLRRIWEMGGRGPYILVNSLEMLSMIHLLEAAGSIVRIPATAEGAGVLGAYVKNVVHPISGEPVPVMVDRFLAPGTMIFGSKTLPDGSPAAEVNVLPQTTDIALAPGEQIQGYVATPLAPTVSAPDVWPFFVKVYEVLAMKAATVFGKLQGVTPV